MEFNKITSDLEFLGTSVKKLSIENTITALSPEAKKSIGLDIRPLGFYKENRFHFSRLTILVTVEVEQENGTTKIDLELEGAFSKPADTDDEHDDDEFQTLVMINGAAALYSICRSKVETVTALTYNSGKLLLPFVNIFEYYKENESETD
jgi:hypothetical protein